MSNHRTCLLDILNPFLQKPEKNYSNMTSFFRFVNKRASYPFGIISLALAPVNVTDFSIGSIYIVILVFWDRN
jgi:hypothetical protein